MIGGVMGRNAGHPPIHKLKSQIAKLCDLRFLIFPPSFFPFARVFFHLNPHQ
jgi:hypothetical protein